MLAVNLAVAVAVVEMSEKEAKEANGVEEVVVVLIEAANEVTRVEAVDRGLKDA